MTQSKWRIDLNGLAGEFLFILFFSILAVSYYDSFLNKGPYSNHAWRQTDCLSLTHHYKEGANFFSPELHNQLGDNYTSGKTAGEFPILYFTIGQLWKITGESYLVYRVFYLLIVFSGLYALFKALKLIFNDWFWATILPLLLFTSPVFVIYGVSFLTDIPAFCFVLIAGYFLTAYNFKKKSKLFWFAILFFSLAGLVKVSSLIGFIFIFGIFLLEMLSIKSLKTSYLFQRSKREWLGFICVFVSVFSWYYYASWFNNKHEFKYTFNEIYPLWLIGKSELIQLTSDIKNFTSHFFFNRSVLICLLLVGIFNLFQWKKMPLIAYLSTIIISLGCSIYVLFWAPLLGIHDYYYSPLLILFLGIFIPFLLWIKIHYVTIFKNKIFKIIILFFTAYNFLYAYGLVRLTALSKESTIIKVNSPGFYKGLKYLNFAYEKAYRFEDIRPYLEYLGIEKTDKLISIPDNSFSISLYLMQHKGWTSYAGGDQPLIIEKLIQKGAKYLVVSEPEMLEKVELKPFLTEKIGEFEGVYIFRL
jgi:hypothetical protein